MKGKIITCCGDCTYYDWKKHKCKNGYNKEDNPKDRFYDDCNIFKDLEEHDNEIYNKAIDDFVKKIQWEYLNGCGIKQSEIEFLVSVSSQVAEQLKAGGKND